MKKEELERLRKELENQLTTRAIHPVAGSYDKEKRSFRVTACSEKPCPVIDWERWEVVNEVLMMSGVHLPDGRAQIPLLDSHNRFSVDNILGNAREFVTETDRQDCTIYFSSIEKGRNAETLAGEGHLTDVSIGYKTEEVFYIPKGQKQTINGKTFEGPLRVATKTVLKELSVTPIGADENCVVKSVRSLGDLHAELRKLGMPENAGDEDALKFLKQLYTKSDSVEAGEGTSITTNERKLPVEETKITPEETARLETERVNAIRAIEKDYGERITGGKEEAKRLADAAINMEQSIERFRGEMFTRVVGTEPIEKPGSFIGMSEKELKAFSFRNAIMQAIPFDKGGMKAGLEAEACRTAKESLQSKGWNSQRNGIIIPYDALMHARYASRGVAEQAMREYGLQKRDLSVGTATAGGNLVGTELMSFIDYLYNKLLLPQLGATYMTGLVGSVAVPKLTGINTVSWEAEAANASTSNATFGQLTLSPKEAQSKAVFSRKLLSQSTPSVDTILLNMLTKAMALGIQTAAFHGTGANNQPTGITNTSNVGDVSGGGYGLAASIEHETDVCAGNADGGTMAFVMNATVRGTLKQRFINIYNSERLVQDNKMNEYLVAMTNAVAASTAIFGDWANLVIAEWGGLMLTVDDLTLGPAQIKITSYQEIDIGVQNPVGFSVCDDIT